MVQEGVGLRRIEASCWGPPRPRSRLGKRIVNISTFISRHIPARVYRVREPFFFMGW
jgi:hypothetical protein